MIEQELRNCPALPDVDIRNVVLSILADFSNDVKTLMNGDSIASSTFQNDWSKLTEQFRNLILHIKPGVLVAHSSDIPDIIDLCDDESESPPPVAMSRKRGPEVQHDSSRKNARMQNNSPVPQYAGDIQPFNTPRHLKREMETCAIPFTPQNRKERERSRRGIAGENPFADTPFAKYAGLGKGFINLDEIRTCIDSHAPPGLPGLVDKKTYDELCMRAIKKWREPLTAFMGQLFTNVREELQLVLTKHLGKYESTELYRSAKKILDEYIDLHIRDQGLASREILELELIKSLTLNRTFMAEQEKKEYDTLKKARFGCLAKAFVMHQSQTEPKKKFNPDMRPEDRSREISKRAAEVDLAKLDDRFDVELKVASYVRAYYLTAAARFLDNTCLCIQSKLFRNIHGSIFRYLERKLEIDNADGKSPFPLPSLSS